MISNTLKNQQSIANVAEILKFVQFAENPYFTEIKFCKFSSLTPELASSRKRLNIYGKFPFFSNLGV